MGDTTEKFDRSLPRVNVVVLGHADHGKTTLTAAMSRVCSEVSGSTRVNLAGMKATPVKGASGVSFKAVQMEYNSNVRHYAHTDFPTHNDCVKGLLGGERIDGAILVVSVADGPMPETREHLRLARQAGIPYIVVFLSKMDTVDEGELPELVETEVRNLLATSGYAGDDNPVIAGSATMALNGEDDGERGSSAVKKLLDALDAYVPGPARAVDQPLLMTVAEVGTADGGTAVTGRIERGQLGANDALEIVGLRETQRATCVSVTTSGQHVTAVLKGAEPLDVQQGQVLIKPGSVKPHTMFTGEVYILAADEGGPATPFTNGYRTQFTFHTAEIQGSCELPEGIEKARPGDNLQLRVTLDTAVALEDGLRFTMREGGKTTGIGAVAQSIE